MKKRDLNIFSVSFLDLLSGALAAVIILFVVVPKMTVEEQAAVETMDELELEADKLKEMVEQLENSVDSSVFQQLLQQVAIMEDALAQSQAAVSEMSARLESSQTQVENLEQDVARLERSLEDYRRSAEEANQRAEEYSKLFGIEAALAIVFQWEENMDIDLFLYSYEYDNWCSYHAGNQPFASLLKDIQEATDESYEMIYQEEVVPGKYDLYINIYDNKDAGTVANPSGYIIMYPGTDEEQRLNLGQLRLAYDAGSGSEYNSATLVRTFTITETSIY